MTLIRKDIKNPWVFLKTRKTAGSSIEGLLLNYLRPPDEVATSGDPEPLPWPFWSTPNNTTNYKNIEAFIKGKARKIGVHKMRLTEHMRAERVRKHVGERFWAEAFKFCVEREPIDRFCSWHRWYNLRHNTSVSMEWVLDSLESDSKDKLRSKHLHHSWNAPIYLGSSGLSVDMVCRFDCLEEDMEFIMERLGLDDIDIDKMPRYKVTGSQQEVDGAISEATRLRIESLFDRECEVYHKMAGKCFK